VQGRNSLARRDRAPTESLPQDDLAVLFSRATALRRDGRVMLQQIRATLREMRELRAELAESRAAAPQAARPNPPDRDGLESAAGLTSREREVAQLLAEGLPNKAIAAELRISPHTARHHTQRVLTKLGVHSRAAAAVVLRGSRGHGRVTRRHG
jgi:DNA-binding NarL/FixJ family response regulator